MDIGAIVYHQGTNVQAYLILLHFALLTRGEIVFFCFFCFFFLIYGCVGSSFLYEGFLQLWQAGATLHRGARASHHRGLSSCGAQAAVAQAQ